MVEVSVDKSEAISYILCFQVRTQTTSSITNHPKGILLKRILSIDYGSRRIGLALSDLLGITAQGLDTLQVRSADQAIERIAEIAAQSEVGTLLIGLPKNMDGTSGKQTEAVRTFGEQLSQKTELPVRFWDERWTSRAAMRTMHEMGLKTKGRKRDVDRIAATMMLQEYLTAMSNEQ